VGISMAAKRQTNVMVVLVFIVVGVRKDAAGSSPKKQP
jgi:hypothetical protein